MGNQCCSNKPKGHPPHKNSSNRNSQLNQQASSNNGRQSNGRNSNSQQIYDNSISVVKQAQFLQDGSNLRKNSKFKKRNQQRNYSKTMDCDKSQGSKSKKEDNNTRPSIHANQGSQTKISTKHRNSLTLQKYPQPKEDNEAGFQRFVYTEVDIKQQQQQIQQQQLQQQQQQYYVRGSTMSIYNNSQCRRNNSDEFHDSKSLNNLVKNIEEYQNKYIEAIDNNFGQLGLNKINLTSQYINSFKKSSLTQQFLSFSQSELMVKDEDLQLMNNETLIYMSKYMQIYGNHLNNEGALFILKEVLSQQGVIAIIDDYHLQQRKQQLVHDDKEDNFYQIFSILNLHLLTTNISTSSLIITFSKFGQVKFEELAKNKQVPQNILSELQSAILETIADSSSSTIKDVIANHKIYQVRLQFDYKFRQAQLVLYISNIQKIQELKIFHKIKEVLPKRFLWISTIQTEQLIKVCRIQVDQMDAFKNHTFKDEESEEKIVVHGGLPYFKPKGWVFYALQQNLFSDQSFRDVELLSNNWGDGYCDLMDGSYSVDYADCEDIGPNRCKFQSEKCGNGFIIYSRADNYNNNRCVSIIFQGTQYKFYFKLKVRFDPTKVRYPKGEADQIYIINDPQDIIIEGFMIKRIKDMHSLIQIVSKSSLNV